MVIFATKLKVFYSILSLVDILWFWLGAVYGRKLIFFEQKKERINHS